MNVVPSSFMPMAGNNGVVITHGGQTTRLRSIWAGEGFPADVRRLLDRLDHEDNDSTLVVTARRISPGAIPWLAEQGISWADAAGHAEINTNRGVYISRQKPKPLPRRAIAGMSWSPSAERVVEYVLCRQVWSKTRLPEAWNGVDRISRIAEATQISPGQVAKVLVMLDDEGYTAKVGPERGPTSTRELRERGRLLSDWAGQYKRSRHKEQRAELHVLSRDPLEWKALMGEQLPPMHWAISGWVGADSIAPFSTSLPDMLVYVSEEVFEKSLHSLINDQDITLVDQGGRIHLRSAPPYVFEFASATRGIPTTSPVRIYADLLRTGGRAADAAEHLREASIGF